MSAYFTDRKLAQRLEANSALEITEYAHTLARLGLRPAAFVQPIADGYAVYTGEDLPINRAGGLGMTAPVHRSDLEELERFYRRRGMRPEIDFCPLADPELLHLLNERGYHMLRFYNVMYRPLTVRPAVDPVPENEQTNNHELAATNLPENPVTITPLGPADTDIWVQTVSHGFSGSDRPVTERLPEPEMVLARTVAQRVGVSCFLALVDGEPAGGGALGMRDGVATLFSASTRPAFRLRGVQQALIQARLSTAAMAGCDLATVLTTPGSNSQRNMERNAFQTAYTRISLNRE